MRPESWLSQKERRAYACSGMATAVVSERLTSMKWTPPVRVMCLQRRFPEVCQLGWSLALCSGIAFGLALTYGGRVLAFPFRILVDVVRGTPVLVLIFASYYMPAGLGVSPGPITAGVAALAGAAAVLARDPEARIALVAPTGFGTPRRTALGFDGARVALLAAVLEKKVGLDLHSCDLFVNVAGGLTLDDPATDLACVAALASSFRDRVLDARTMVLGEVGLAGEVRTVAQGDARLAEAARLGFARALVPAGNARHAEIPAGLEVEAVETVSDALDLLFG